MQMTVASTKMLDCITLMELIAYSVSVSGSLNSMYNVCVLCDLCIYPFNDILLQLLDGSKALLKEKNDLLPM